MAPFTKEMLLEDFGNGMQEFGWFFSCLVGAKGAAAAFGRADTDFDAKDLAKRLPGSQLVSDAYDYAYNGRLRMGTFRDESDEMEALLGLFQGLQTAVLEFSGAHFKLCVRTMEMAHRRKLLDGALNFTSRGPLFHHIHLKELAELAGVDEKTLRNMASPKHPARIETEKIDGRTFVSLKVAIPWLVARGFRPTVFEYFSADRSFASGDGFLSVLDFAEYVRHASTKVGLSPAQLADKLEGRGAAELERVERGFAPSDEGILRKIASLLKVKYIDEFVASALELQDSPYVLAAVANADQQVKDQ